MTNRTLLALALAGFLAALGLGLGGCSMAGGLGGSGLSNVIGQLPLPLVCAAVGPVGSVSLALMPQAATVPVIPKP